MAEIYACGRSRIPASLSVRTTRNIGGRVVDVEFGGATCTVAVSLAAVALPPILIKTSSVALPARGDLVRLDIAGKAHVFSR